MTRFGTQYQVARATGRCAATQRELSPGESCVATLCERAEDEGFDRLDFSPEAWEAGHRPERLFSFWRTVVAAPEERRKLLVDDEVLLDLFHRLADDDREHRRAFRFVLALILMRKRQLRYVGRSGSGAEEVWRFLPRGAAADDRPLEATNPQLGDDDVRELTAQLTEILQGEV